LAGDKSQKGAGKQEKVTIQKQPDVLYSRSELIEAASSFGVKPEVIAGALKMVAKDCMTKAEAKEAIKKFLERKV
jgi:hypothetical protein